MSDPARVAEYLNQPEGLLMWADKLDTTEWGFEIAAFLRDVAALAAAGYQLQPPTTTCPTCGSTQPGAPHTGRWWWGTDGELLNRHGRCPDGWHSDV